MPIYIDSVVLPTSVKVGDVFLLSVAARHVPLTWKMLSDQSIRWDDVKQETWKTLDALKVDAGN